MTPGHRLTAPRELTPASEVPRELTLDVGPVAHGGHCVARSDDGRVVFVRHALPGEQVVARVTEGGTASPYWRADAVRVIRSSPDRVPAPCPVAGPGLCGGCDLQHVSPAGQRAWKAAVVVEQLARVAGLHIDVVVEQVEGPGVDAAAGLGWRTRVRYAVDDEGRAGFRAHRSHDVVPVATCLICHPAVAAVGVTRERWPGVLEVQVDASPVTGEAIAVVHPGPGGPRRLPPLPGAASLAVAGPQGLERVRGRTWVAHDADLPSGSRRFRVSGAGFWQAHAGAPSVLAAAVVQALRPRPGERAVDLYCGAGLLAAALADAVGGGGEVGDGREGGDGGGGGDVLAVEGDPRAVADARRSLHASRNVEIVHGRVDRVLRQLTGPRDLVVLDPPRTGAKTSVVRGVAALRPRAVAYVACDPAALAADLVRFAACGYRLASLRAFDLFPHTHHVECLALLVQDGRRDRLDSQP